MHSPSQNTHGIFDDQIKLMLDASPLCTAVFNKNNKVIDCNRKTLEVFEFESVDEYIKYFPKLWPRHQPDGSLSWVKSAEYFKKAMNEGSCRFGIVRQKLNEELLPCEATFVRITHNGEYYIVAYLEDLREQKKMLRIYEQQAHLLDTVNTVAAILLANNDINTFESLIMKCFNLIGHCLDVDRVQIWRNEMINDMLHFVLRNEWLSEHGKTCVAIPMGLHFPYSMKKEWEDLFMHGQHINAPLCELSEEDQSFLGFYEMKSIVIIPMFLEGKFWGFFSIDDCRNERTFSKEEINILTSAGLMISIAINRNVQALNMREAEERTKLMIDAAPLCAIFWDKNMKLVDCNQEAVNMFGLSGKQEFLDNFNSLSPLYQPDEVLSTVKGGRLVREAFINGYSRFEWVHQKLDGEQIPADVICIRVKHMGEDTVTEYIRDLREQKAMMAEMRKAEIAEQSSKAKSDFLAKMSHEIRTPMNAIIGITEIQLQDASHSQQTKEAFERIYNSGELLLGIINDILDLSRIEVGKLVLVPAQYDIASLINDTIQLVIMRYESKPIEFKLNVDENLPMTVIGDEIRIKQILNNVLSNAYKYTMKGNVSFNVYCEASPEDETEKIIVFEVSDTGIGMTAEQVTELGTEYSRFNMETNRRTEGAGLGMNITRNLVQLMNGKILIESVPGTGTTITVRIPQKYSDSSVLGAEIAKNLMLLEHDKTSKIRNIQMTKEFMPYGRVLVVDDVETNLYVARGLMASYGLSIETAMSGFEAIEKIKGGFKYDIIFMDHMMPKMDGIEATQIIRDMDYKKPIIALTANALTGHAEMFLKSGFDDFISKPIDIRQLNLVLNRFIRDKYPTEVVEKGRKQKTDLFFNSDGKRQINSQLAEFFVRDAEKAIKVMEGIYINKFRRAEDINDFIINIHAMKSALANINETKLSASAAKLEQAARDQNIKSIISGLPSFLDLLYTILKKYQPKEESPGDEERDEDPVLKEKLLLIKKECEAYNKGTAKTILEDLKNQIWSKHVKDLLAEISVHLLHSEFEEAANAIDNYLKLS